MGDKLLNISSHSIILAVLQYQTAARRGDFDSANDLLTTILQTEYTMVETSMAVTTDPDHKFNLALEINHIDVAHTLLRETKNEETDSTDTMAKRKRLSDAALKESNFELYE